MASIAPKGLIVTLAVLLAALTGFAKQSATDLLDDAIQHPGGWNQMCLNPRPIPFEVPLPLYSLSAPRFSVLSSNTLARLEARRAEIIPEIVRRLHNTDFAKMPARKDEYSGPNGSNQDPRYLSGLLLQIILKLNAVETLPELMHLEFDLNQRLDRAPKDGGVSLPDLDLDSPVHWEEKGGDLKATEEKKRLFAARIFQREMLSVMAALLRHEKYPPLLASKIESAYRSQSAAREASNPELAWRKDCAIPYTPELRQEIRKFVYDYLKQPTADRNKPPPPK